MASLRSVLSFGWSTPLSHTPPTLRTAATNGHSTTTTTLLSSLATGRVTSFLFGSQLFGGWMASVPLLVRGIGTKGAVKKRFKVTGRVGNRKIRYHPRSYNQPKTKDLPAGKTDMYQSLFQERAVGMGGK
eukprot:TRINITY_DN16557_c0_g1_i1.p1 TRINITY_DN16557_c0_g1~~TRINITY_DN16557_c0_g1_i1.p1  ORF type:complete len:130 (-),score=27.18 TRINITY_DN16557_c0_g1_i1:8-397(-)